MQRPLKRIQKLPDLPKTLRRARRRPRRRSRRREGSSRPWERDLTRTSQQSRRVQSPRRLRLRSPTRAKAVRAPVGRLRLPRQQRPGTDGRWHRAPPRRVRLLAPRRPAGRALQVRRTVRDPARRARRSRRGVRRRPRPRRRHRPRRPPRRSSSGALGAPPRPRPPGTTCRSRKTTTSRRRESPCRRRWPRWRCRGRQPRRRPGRPPGRRPRRRRPRRRPRRRTRSRRGQELHRIRNPPTCRRPWIWASRISRRKEPCWKLVATRMLPWTSS
mmetsp:Transcript_64019/g.187316  ORF Transcript_64019/g.187316 Transcript_64019/m.187316 type:complete len:272 (-) Transcript_64019:131-946(-)